VEKQTQVVYIEQRTVLVSSLLDQRNILLAFNAL